MEPNYHMLKIRIRELNNENIKLKKDLDFYKTPFIFRLFKKQIVNKKETGK